ncbi:MAG: heme-binding domain-containing protein [Flavobacteriales bacterium]|nr:heme-binding domain-containing protein [Flavobacteriales bacterium]
MESLKYIFFFFLALFLVIQLKVPEKNQGDLDVVTSFVNNVDTPNNVKAMLTNACYDCHSNNTKYPWYADVAPISWYVAGHVEDGKKRLNFTEWQNYSKDEKQKKLEKISNLIKRRWMPMHEYLGQHPEALMSNDEIAIYSEWFSKVETQ